MVLKPELTIQYADFAQWQREWLTGPVQTEQMASWKSEARKSSRHVAARGSAATPVHSFKGEHVSTDLPWN
ncbi:MAG: hypothetical protein U0361_05920 [Nitrospiraceae bacterium]